MIVQRTLAEFLASTIDGIAVFKDESAWQVNPQFPYLLTTLTGNKRESLGAGLRDFLTENDETKVYYNERTIRFTFRAVSTAEENGNDIVSRLVSTADEIFRQLTRPGGITLTDSVTLKPVRIAYAEYERETDVQTITDRLPVVYQKAITFKFRIVDPTVFQVVSPPMNQIQVQL